MTTKNQRKNNKNEEVCGMTTHNGKPCQRPAGWGTNNNTGPCTDHLESKLQAIKKEFLKNYREKICTFQGAAKRAGVDQSTIWQYRQRDPQFDQKVREAVEQQDQKRVKVVEDTIFKRIARDEATPSLIKFWLRNRGGGRWIDRPETQINVSQTQSQQVDNKELIDLLREAYRERKEKEKDEGEAELKVKPIR